MNSTRSDNYVAADCKHLDGDKAITVLITSKGYIDCYLSSGRDAFKLVYRSLTSNDVNKRECCWFKLSTESIFFMSKSANKIYKYKIDKNKHVFDLDKSVSVDCLQMELMDEKFVK